jgi:hypothetical protein
MAIIASTITANSVILMKDGHTHVINDEHPNYNAVREAMKLKNYDEVEKLMDVGKTLTTYAKGKVRIENGAVYYEDLEIKNSVVTRIFAMQNEGFDVDPMLAFLENLMANPSRTAVDELYLFLEATALPITEDGHFLAYKKVNDNYKDFYSGKFDHKIGTVLEVPRNSVDDNRNNTCSQGLHFCSLSYLPYYHGGRGRVMILKINPADVVTIPSDYKNAKGRAFKYTVFGEHTGGETTEAWTTSVYVEPKSVDQEDANEYNDVKVSTDTTMSADEIAFNAGLRDAQNGYPFNTIRWKVQSQVSAYASGWTKGKIPPVTATVSSVAAPVKRTLSDAQLGSLAGANAARRDASSNGNHIPNPPAGKSQSFVDAFIKTYNNNR